MKTIQLITRHAALALGVVTLVWLAGCDDDGTGPSDERAEQDFSFDIDASAVSRLRVEGINGGIAITGSATATSVIVQGVREVRGPNARSHLAELQVATQQVGDEVVVRTTQPSPRGNRQYTVDYEIVIPRRLAVSVLNANGGIAVASVANDVSVANANGGIVLDDIVGDVLVQLGNGAVEADVTLPLDGTLEMGVGNGEIDLRIPRSTSALFSASVGTGMITLANLTLEDVVSTPATLSGRLGTGRGAIDLTLGNGTITVTGF